MCRDRVKHSDRFVAAPKGRTPRALSSVERMCRKMMTKEGKKPYSGSSGKCVRDVFS